MKEGGWGKSVSRSLPAILLLALLLAAAEVRAGGWVTYSNETSLRLVTTDPLVGSTDVEEKDYAWGDVDKDGDVDLIVVRKTPFTNPGGKRNVLYMNEQIADGQAIDGVLVDRTSRYIPDFMDMTNDRDVVLADVTGDTWLDIITSTTLGGMANPKSITHPRVYINLRNDAGGNWLGFSFDDVDRIPTMPFEPRLCGVAAGDLDNDNDLDLYFVDYERGEPERQGDLNDRLLINDGSGYFTDESGPPRITEAMLESDFGVNVVIADMNGDGWNDIVKCENRVVKVINNDGTGSFDIFEEIYDRSAYHIDVGRLNSDGMLDIVVADDGTDRYLLNQGNGGNGLANFTETVLPDISNDLGGNCLIVDLNNDGFNDVIMTDVDVDIPGCIRVTEILRNDGNSPNVTFTSDPANIPSNMLTGVHDVAVFDLDGDGLKDLILGRCTGTQVWINTAAPVGIVISYPGGLPEFLVPDTPIDIQVSMAPFGDTVLPGSPEIHLSLNEGLIATTALVEIGADLYLATLPAAACGDRFDFYFSVQLIGGLSFNDPEAAPVSTYGAIVTEGTAVLFHDEMEGAVSGWTVQNDPSLTGGQWEQAVPNATICCGGQTASPEDDATPLGTLAFITENGVPGGAAAASDVDGGPTRLISPLFDLTGTDAIISYARWAFSSAGIHDALIVEVSNDAGANWAQVEAVLSTGGVWETAMFLLSDFVVPSASVQVRFSIADPDASVTEAGVDDFDVTVLCGAACPGDIDFDGVIGVPDLLILLAAWGPNPGHAADLDFDGVVAVPDLLTVLSGWGPCP